jgi:tetratricopeptide (TPR) repeat protein
MMPESAIHPAELYARLLGGDGQSRRALLACSAALRLDDKVAHEAVALVAQSNGSTDKLLQEIKSLACVWRRWDGSWHLNEEVRSYLADRLAVEVEEPVQQRLRELLAAHADGRLRELSPDGPLTAYRARATKIEAAFHKVLTPGRAEEGGRGFGQVWSEAKGTAKQATCEAVAHLSREVGRRLQRLPDEVLFLRGMSAYQRGDRRSAERDFEAVYKNGQPGEIYGIAAHLYGLLVKRAEVAEQAFRNGIRWLPTLAGQGQVWHSLGNLLSKDRPRWKEAEAAYAKSLELDASPEGQGQVWHSLGNLLSKDRSRWKEAEAAFRKSLELDPSHDSQGQVRASWADGLMKLGDPSVYDDVEEHALAAQRLDPRPKTRGVTNRVLADLYEARGQWAEAIAALEALQETDRLLHYSRFESVNRRRVDRLRRKIAAGSPSGS